MIDFNKYVDERGELTEHGKNMFSSFRRELNYLVETFAECSEQERLLFGSILAREVGNSCFRVRKQ